MQNRLIILALSISFFSTKGQENRTTFGFQYKPIIPSEYFNSTNINKAISNYSFNLIPKYSNSFGMILRSKINKTFAVESGLNYTQRNYRLFLENNIIPVEDFTSFGIRSYEIPIQLLTYVRATEFWYLNVAFGISHNILASDILSFGKNSKDYFQNMYRKNGGYSALLANIGMEYRSKQRGYYYVGTSLHLPWKEIGRSYPEYNDGNSIFNNDQFENKFFLEISGNFITIDFRYFFPEKSSN